MMRGLQLQPMHACTGAGPSAEHAVALFSGMKLTLQPVAVGPACAHALEFEGGEQQAGRTEPQSQSASNSTSTAQRFLRARKPVIFTFSSCSLNLEQEETRCVHAELNTGCGTQHMLIFTVHCPHQK
jgi:hypothetical protein